VLELTYTAHDLALGARPGPHGPPFAFDPDRRAVLRAELDAYYARLYGLTRDELRYILDPADVMGADYPSRDLPRAQKRSSLREAGACASSASTAPKAGAGGRRRGMLNHFDMECAPACIHGVHYNPK
jgi:hypothetical protein